MFMFVYLQPFLFKPGHFHIIAGRNPGRSGKPALADLLRTTVTDNFT